MLKTLHRIFRPRRCAQIGQAQRVMFCLPLLYHCRGRSCSRLARPWLRYPVGRLDGRRWLFGLLCETPQALGKTLSGDN